MVRRALGGLMGREGGEMRICGRASSTSSHSLLWTWLRCYLRADGTCPSSCPRRGRIWRLMDTSFFFFLWGYFLHASVYRSGLARSSFVRLAWLRYSIAFCSFISFTLYIAFSCPRWFVGVMFVHSEVSNNVTVYLASSDRLVIVKCTNS